MNYDRQKKLVLMLVDKTAEGQLEWKTSVDDDAFHVTIKENTIQIRKVMREDVLDAVISIINDRGIEVDSFSDVDLNSNEPSGHKHWYSVMDGLYSSARRAAFGSDKILNKVLKDLEE